MGDFSLRINDAEVVDEVLTCFLQGVYDERVLDCARIAFFAHFYEQLVMCCPNDEHIPLIRWDMAAEMVEITRIHDR